MVKVIAGIDYLAGYLKYGHFELNLNESKLEEFKNLSKEEQIDYIKEDGDLIIDDYELNDYGDITDIEIVE